MERITASTRGKFAGGFSDNKLVPLSMWSLIPAGVGLWGSLNVCTRPVPLEGFHYWIGTLTCLTQRHTLFDREELVMG